MKQYDIFISYRRKDAGDKAEHLKDLLELKYKGRVSFDRENLTGIFDVALAKRIDSCKDFLLVLGKKSLSFEEKVNEDDDIGIYNYLATCSIEDFERKILELGPEKSLDFVRIEIARALQRKVNIIPIVPERSVDFDFSKLVLPADIAGVKRYEAVFYSDNPDALFKDVIAKISPRLISKPYNRFMKIIRWILSLLLLVAISFFGFKYILYQQVEKEKNELKFEIEQLAKEIEIVCLQPINWDPDITMEQLVSLRSIIANQEKVQGGSFMQGVSQNGNGEYDDDVCVELETPQLQRTVETFYIGKYELSVAEWCGIMMCDVDVKNEMLPMANVSLEECIRFTKKLSDLIGLNFRLPTETEWEYAARGGMKSEGTKYAGSNDADEVAWYGKQANGKPRICDATNSPLYCNELDLYDMSGNVSEWCFTPFRPYDPNVLVPDSTSMVIRGGYFESEHYELTVYHRDMMKPDEKSEYVGLRLVIGKE